VKRRSAERADGEWPMADSVGLEWEAERVDAVIEFRAICHQLSALPLNGIRFTKNDRLSHFSTNCHEYCGLSYRN
jgi:hypothetical protein